MTDDEITTPDNLTEDEARMLVDDLKHALERAYELLSAIIATEAWKTLGYTSLEVMWEKELSSTDMIRVPRDQRRELARAMSGEGMSQRKIAKLLGVNNATISRDLAPESVANATPEIQVTESEVQQAVRAAEKAVDHSDRPEKAKAGAALRAADQVKYGTSELDTKTAEQYAAEDSAGDELIERISFLHSWTTDNSQLLTRATIEIAIQDVRNYLNELESM